MTQSDFFEMKVHFFVVKTSAKNLLILQKKKYIFGNYISRAISIPNFRSLAHSYKRKLGGKIYFSQSSESRWKVRIYSYKKPTFLKGA